MKRFAAIILTVVLAETALADPALIIKQRAKDTANQNNAQQGQPPQYPGAASPGSPAPAPVPLTPEQKAFLTVANDLAVPKAEDAKKLATDLMAIGFAASKSTATIQKLAKDLIAALEGKSATPEARSRIVQGIRTVMNGGAQPAAKIDPYIADVSAILKIAGANATAVATVNADLKTLRTETLPAPVESPIK